MLSACWKGGNGKSQFMYLLSSMPYIKVQLMIMTFYYYKQWQQTKVIIAIQNIITQFRVQCTPYAAHNVS